MALCAALSAPAAEPFLEKPYLQLGDAPRLAGSESVSVLWHTTDADDKWLVEYRQGAGRWQKSTPWLSHRVAVTAIDPHRVMEAKLSGLKAGVEFAYRVKKGDQVVFEAKGMPRKAADQPYRFVAMGDCAQNTDGQRAIATQIVKAKPDFVFIAGDIVYGRGKISEYREKYFPIYNSDQTPLLRFTITLAAPGNHDTAVGNLLLNPDAMAYFYYWSQPRNGFDAPAPLTGTDSAKRAFLDSAGSAYPAMANFSFDYGNAHWTVLDSNKYNDWTKPEFREWLVNDLKSAQKAVWRFVGFHHPGFNSSKAHFDDQWMRLLAPLFEEYKVDVVFAGHVHNYQRSWPLRFAPDPGQPCCAKASGKWTLDKSYDGKAKTRPDGIIYLVTGAGGAGLYNPEQTGHPETWQEFTVKFESAVHSMTQVDVDGRKLTFRQIAADGRELDAFVVSK